jgi:hypothetical protein
MSDNSILSFISNEELYFINEDKGYIQGPQYISDCELEFHE